MATATTTTEAPAVVPTAEPAANTQQSQMAAMLASAGVASDAPPQASTPSADVAPSATQPGEAPASATVVDVTPSPTTPAASDPSELAAPTEGVVDLQAAMAKINELSAEINKLKEAPVAKAEAAVPATIPNYVTAEEMESGKLGTAEGINEVMHRVRQQALEDAMRVIPGIVKDYTLKSTAEVTAINSFYDANKDLVPHKPFVGKVAKVIFDANPGKPLEALLPEVAKVARDSIRELIKSIPAPAVPTNPTTPSATQAAPTPTLTGQAKMMRDMLESAGLA